MPTALPILVLFIFLYTFNGNAQKNNTLNTSHCNNWDTFREKIHSIGQNKAPNKINILFLGDSHIQGGYSVNRTRNLINENVLNAGRGFLFPYKYAQTNGPEDILFSSNATWEFGKWNNPADQVNSPFGYVISTKTNKFGISISFNPNETKYPFQKITLFHSPDSFKIKPAQLFNNIKTGKLNTQIFYTTICYNKPIDSCQINFVQTTNNQSLSFYGFYIENENENISINALGINGISFQHYKKMDFEPWLLFLKPECIILSLGTNDTYPVLRDSTLIIQSVAQTIQRIKTILPNVTLILTTPNDHLVRKKYVNKGLITITNIIKKISENEQCVLWDFFEVMGSIGSSRTWHSKGLMFKDYIHLSKAGYKHQGELFFEAFMDALDSKNN